MLVLALVVAGAWGMPGGSETGQVDMEDASGNAGDDNNLRDATKTKKSGPKSLGVD